MKKGDKYRYLGDNGGFWDKGEVYEISRVMGEDQVAMTTIEKNVVIAYYGIEEDHHWKKVETPPILSDITQELWQEISIKQQDKLDKAIKTLGLIEKAQYEDGNYISFTGMREIAKQFLKEIEDEKR